HWDSMLQATVFAADDPVLALAAHRIIYGDVDLADVSAERVAGVLLSTLRQLDRIELLMTGPAAGVGSGEIRRVQSVKESPHVLEQQASTSVAARPGVLKAAASRFAWSRRPKIRRKGTPGVDSNAELPSVVRDESGTR